jgi:hypothetical protein
VRLSLRIHVSPRARVLDVVCTYLFVSGSSVKGSRRQRTHLYLTRPCFDYYCSAKQRSLVQLVTQAPGSALSRPFLMSLLARVAAAAAARLGRSCMFDRGLRSQILNAAHTADAAVSALDGLAE